MRFIGDVHAKFKQYLEIASAVPESIQVGDFGVGFAPVPILPEGARFIRGNHDDPQGCQQISGFIPDGSSMRDIFFVGGGESIDRHNRTPGIDWWADEQLSMVEFYDVMDSYETIKPRVMVSHECPSDMVPFLGLLNSARELNPSRTSQALSGMLYQHQPEIWIFGHWHQRVDQLINGTRFICLEELGWIDL